MAKVKRIAEIQKLFPVDSVIVDCTIESDLKYLVTLRLKCAVKEEFKSWLAAYRKRSGVVFRVAVTKPRTGKTVLYKAVYRCEHNTYPESHFGRVKTPRKHTGCAAKLNVTIKSSTKGRLVRSKDTLRAEYPTIVTIVHDHNHIIGFAKAFKSKTVEGKVQHNLSDFAKSQHCLSKALDIFEGEPVNFQPCFSEKIITEVPNSEYHIICTEMKNSKYHISTDVQNLEYQIISTGMQDAIHQISESYSWRDSESKLMEIMEILKIHFESNPKDVSEAISAMHSKLKSTKTTSCVISTLHSIGKDTVSPSMQEKKARNVIVGPTIIFPGREGDIKRGQ